MLFLYWHPTGHAKQMQKESRDKRRSAQKQVTGNYSLVFFFLNTPKCYEETLYWAGTEHFNEINIPIFFFDFLEYWRTQFLDNRTSELWNFQFECPNRGYSHFLTDLAEDPDHSALNVDSSYIFGKGGKGDLLLNFRNEGTM